MSMFIVLDLETTGLSSRDDSIIEYAFIKIDRQSFREVDRFHGFINPKRSIPELISQITNIFDDDVINAPVFDMLLDDIQDFIEGFPLIGHNVQFDLRFLESHGVDISKNPSIDTFFLANILCYDIASLNLWYLCNTFNIDLTNAHRAIDDAVATWLLFQKLIEKLQNHSGEGSQDLLQYFFSNCTDVWVRILRDEYLDQPNKNIALEEIEAAYIRALEENQHKASKIYSSNKKLDILEVIDTMPWFEIRESQKQMLEYVDSTFSHWNKTLIEAPTWIGKTFAYLIPAIKHSLSFWEPFHISTSTKALQDQIFYKDLAFLHTHFPEAFSYTKLKWKKNYLWVRPFIDFIESSSIQDSVRTGFILKILFWSIKTQYWELEELNFFGEEWKFMNDIHAWDITVMDASNAYKEVEFVVRARMRAKTSNIIITNNHILFQDVSSEGSLLWGVRNLVLDEAHTLEDIVTSSLKETLSFQLFQSTLQKIEQKGEKYKISNSIVKEKKQHILFDVAEIFSIYEGFIFEKFSFDSKYKMLALSEKFYTQREELVLLSQRVVQNLRTIYKEMSSLEGDKGNFFSRELQDIHYILEFIEKISSQRNFWKNIYYATHDDQKGTQIHITVLKPGEFLDQYLWNKLDSVVLTSATLQMGNSYEYIQKMLNVHDFSTLTLKSDFDYSKQALAFIPQDLWSIKYNTDEIIRFLESFFFRVRGQTLALFSSFAVIRAVYTSLKIKLQKDGINLSAQSISWSKIKLIDSFRFNSHNSVLLWTDTFWEWIDIPWEDLKYLIVHKIPFNAPTDPVFMARSKLFKDSFTEYAIPKSILKLKQGFGRLIRSKSDSGVIIFLDDRIYSTRWGEAFLQAFPEWIKVRYGESEKLLDLLKN